MYMKRWYRWTGAVLLLVGAVGVLTVADDLRHTGELLGVAGIVCAALCLLVAGFDHRITKRVAIQWVAVGIGVGEIAGVAFDHMVFGVGGGAVMGLLLAVLLVPTRS